MPGSEETVKVQEDAGSPLRHELLKRIYEELRQVVDPEIGLNVVDLGLVYEVIIEDQKVHLRMGLTTPLCPYGPELLRTAEMVVRDATGFPQVEVEYVMDPPWNPSMMSPEARAILGLD
jgi:metal-sulfur cluster biosynthetic enzyme